MFLWKKMFLKILQNLQGNTCARVFFNKVTVLKPPTLFKKETLAQVFSGEFWKIFKNFFFNRIPLGDCFCKASFYSKATAVRCSVKNVFRNSSQNSQENNCVGVCFLSFSFIKKENQHRCFPLNFAKFKRTFFYRTPTTGAFSRNIKTQMFLIEISITLLYL